MATSTIPAFIDALLARLGADSSLAGVLVCDSVPDAATREMLIVWGTRDDSPDQGSFPGGQSSAAIGQRSREERYVVELLVTVVRPRREGQTGTRARAFELAAVVENSLRSWGEVSPRFAGIVRFAGITSVHYDPTLPNSDTRGANVWVEIACQQRI
jgi:hypothetical protein